MENIKSFQEFLFEGRYDKLTSKTVKSLWPVIKVTRVAGESEYVLNLDEISEGGIFFDLILEITRMPIPIPQGFVIDAGAYTQKGNNALEIIIKIDPTKEPQVYTKLNAKLQDAVRHEIEHLTQSGKNKVPGKPTATRAKTRDKINIDNNNIYKYFLLRDEIPAMVHGMYRQAKTEKRKLDEIFNEYLQYFIDEKIISNGEMEIVLDAWIRFAKKKLPAAQYSKETK
jgi:hypothetical protein